MKDPNPEIRRLVLELYDACLSFGWDLEIDHVSTNRNTVYCQLVRPDGFKARLRVSDHRSRRFKTGKYLTPKGIQRMAFEVLTFRPATYTHFMNWLRSKRAGPRVHLHPRTVEASSAGAKRRHDRST